MTPEQEKMRMEFESAFAYARSQRGKAKMPDFARRIDDGSYLDASTQRHFVTWSRAYLAGHRAGVEEERRAQQEADCLAEPTMTGPEEVATGKTTVSIVFPQMDAGDDGVLDPLSP